MSAVELAVQKVKKLSAREAREVLAWLDKKQTNGKLVKRRKPSLRRATRDKSMAELKRWEDSVRLTTDWEPPRMSDEMILPEKS